MTLRTVADASRVRCDIVDTGVGMSPELRERIFEPFFSTKTEKGSGLGLSIVYGIVSRLGGEITVESTPGIGSVFRMWLPVAEGFSVAAAERPSAPQTSRSVRILVVDDEAEVRQALAEMLELEGHVPVECSDGPAALRALDTETFELVLTDLGMPGMGGWEFVRAVKQRNPRLPVGLITGWGDSIDPADATRRGADFLLAKPFQMRELHYTLARVPPGQTAVT